MESSGKKKAGIGIITGLVVLGGAASYAVQGGPQVDNGLIGICWADTPRGETRYEVDGAKDCREMEWREPDMPLQVKFLIPDGSRTTVEEAKLIVGLAIDSMNSQLGFTAFVRDPAQVWELLGDDYDEERDGESPPSSTPRVFLTLGHPQSEVEEVEFVRKDPEGFPGECKMREGAVSDQNTRVAVIMHGLGHCLGLAHDQGVGIMARALVVEPGADLPTLTLGDRETLRDTYPHLSGKM